MTVPKTFARIVLGSIVGATLAAPARAANQHWRDCDGLTDTAVAQYETWFRQAELKVIRENTAQLGIPVETHALELGAQDDLTPLHEAILQAMSGGDRVLVSSPREYYELDKYDAGSGRWLAFALFSGTSKAMTLSDVVRSDGGINGLFLLKGERDQGLAFAKIACYESTFELHAVDGAYLGLFQIDQPKIDGYGVGMTRYWNGSGGHGPAYYQILTGSLYIKDRYGNSLVAWEHERDYGWY